MADNHDYIALDWVRGEIAQTLVQARTALEAFVEDQSDLTQITFCLNYIHQVHGTLQMVEFYGAALLAEEMEKLCQAMLEGKVSSIDEALDVMMESLLQLDNYLEHIQSGQRDLPVILLPILNDLRALQGQPLLSDTSLFTPDIAGAMIHPNPDDNARMQDPQVSANLRKLRQMFQHSLAGIVRNQDLAANFGYLYRVLARLEKFCQGTPIGQIWWVAVAFLDAIDKTGVNLSSANKQLLRDLDHYIKKMIDEADSILSQPAPLDLLKNMLYYVAKTEAHSKRIDEISAIFKLADALPTEAEVNAERERLHGPGKETMVSVVQALTDELNQVKDRLDIFVRGKERHCDALLDLVPILNQVANTMAVLGLGIARKIVMEQVAKIQLLTESQKPITDQELMDMAGALLYVEAHMATLTDERKFAPQEESVAEEEFVVPREHFESAHNAVVFESRNGLEQAKNSIVNFIASQWDHSEIEGVPELLDSIRGGLQIIPLPRAAKLLEACSRYIRESLLSSKAIPDWQQLDRLADAITSIEYYLERLSEGAQDNERILQIAEESVYKLGYPVSGGTSQNIPVLSEHHVSEVASESPDAVVKQRDEDLIDSEILEIFREEAAEVMLEIHAAMNSVAVNNEDLQALKDLRRAFHTLKGSGRLVGAMVVGDLAWSVESLLNRYLEKYAPLDDRILDFLDGVIRRLPELMDDFAEQRASRNYENLIEKARFLEANFMSGSPQQQTAAEDRAHKVGSQKVQAEEDDAAIHAVSDVAATEEPNVAATVSPVIKMVEDPVEVEEPLTASKPAQAAIPVDNDDLIDDEILEIFIEEASEVEETMRSYLPVFMEEHDNKEALAELRRAFHTLKGSGRMVGAMDIGETAWAIENMLNRVIDGSILMNGDIAQLVRYVIGIVPELVENFKQGSKPSLDLALITRQAEALAKGDFISLKLPKDSGVAVSADVASVPEQAAVEASGSHGMDDSLLDIFKNEAATHLATVRSFIARVTEEHPVAIDDGLSRALHTLKGSANTADIKPIAMIAIPVEKFIKEARANHVDVDMAMAQMLMQASSLIDVGMAQLETTPQRVLPETEAFLAELGSLHRHVLQEASEDESLAAMGAPDPQLVSIFLTEGLDILLDAEKILNSWREHPVPGDDLGKLISEVKTLHRGAKVAGLESIAELCECLDECYASIDIGFQQPSENFLNDIKLGHDALIDMMDQVAAGLTAAPQNKLLAQLRQHAVEQASCKAGLANQQEPVASQPEELVAQAPVTESEEVAVNVAATTDDSAMLLDPELVEIFLEEAHEIINGFAPALAQLNENPLSEHILVQLQRDAHTLKGGARLAQIQPIGDLAQSLEKLFEYLVATRSAASDANLVLLRDADAALQGMLKAIEEQQPMEDASALNEQLLAALRVTEDVTEPEDTDAHIKIAGAETIEEATVASASAPAGAEVEEEKIGEEIEEEATLADLDPELIEIFLEEATDIIDSSGALLHQWRGDVNNTELVAELQRELHTLKGGARMAELAPIGDLAHELETLFEAIVERGFAASGDMVSLCLKCHDALAGMVDAVKSGQSIRQARELLNQVKAILSHGMKPSRQADEASEVAPSQPEAAVTEQTMAPVASESAPAKKKPVLAKDDLDVDLLPLFIDESKDILVAAADYMERWKDDDKARDGAFELQREMHTLKGGARLADVDAIGDIAEAVEKRLEHLLEGGVPDPRSLMAVVALAYQELTEMIEHLVQNEPIEAKPDLVKAIRQAGRADAAVSSETGTAAARKFELVDDLSSLDPEVLEMFADEAIELMQALDEQISGWSKNPENDFHNRELQRVLHTLKGGARLSNITRLADASHDLETLLIDAQKAGRSFDGELKGRVLASQEVLAKFVDELKLIVKGGLAESKTPVQRSSSPAMPKVTKPVVLDMESKVVVKTRAERQKASQKALAQETVRVSAGLMEELVNLAGETSIARGRLEQQISDFGFTLEEMAATIERLREQLRRMEMETEAQVLFRAEREGFGGPDYEDFDPLEMDRYSAIQQLSRSLTESTTDLLELRDTLAERTRDAETLLLQQSRINSELQEGLMKTRMIPFSSMVPRLRRIVRQIGDELKKDVEFDVQNPEGEMDRSILERMVAPLEHMLRNALDHGIESAEDRRKVGKPETGTITLSLSREGGNVVLRMRDDGAGINDERVLAKALSQGLIKSDAKLNRHDILQFIMLPGFSTAEKVTQISGRGVGMDVVASEIKQMGGSIEIDSVVGKGTEFCIRLPFTVSVNRALMVSIGEDFYAIPLNTIEGIVRVSTYELEEYYRPDAPAYEYAGRQYKLQYLGQLLNTHHQPKLQGQPLPLPVILVRGTDSPMALQVDSLMGSREIVVKSLGPQFADVHGVSGATILGDGSVVVILDLPAMIREEGNVTHVGYDVPVEEFKPVEQRTNLVMVVDDSVTVRKVTTRLLERSGMDVITAKDGVDAIALLQDHKPDVMLLDIEMPRMDGFEVATLVRHDERLKDVPIIMITSRTGQKHRDRAFAIGVNEYLGKPFQEQDLLQTIERLTRH